jgi:hypothetical protein
LSPNRNSQLSIQSAVVAKTSELGVAQVMANSAARDSASVMQRLSFH